MGTTIEAAALDPTVALGTGIAGATELTAFYDTVMRYIPETGEYEPHLAESLTPNDDLTEWTLTLRDGVEFGNGDALTTEAVQVGIERLAASSRSAAGLAQAITEMEIVDDSTIILRTESSNGSVPYIMSTEVGMPINPAILDQQGGEAFANDPTGAGAGPYELERFAPGEELVLTAKDDYWGGPVCIETLRFINVPGAQGTWDAFQNGELDLAFLSDLMVISEAREAGAEAYAAVSGANLNLILNNREGSPTADVRVRQAIAQALDPELIAQRVYEGQGLPTTCLIHPDQLIHPAVDCPEHDPEAARELVEEAKADGWDGSLRLVYGDTPEAVDESIIVEALLTDVGIQVERENLPRAEQNERFLTPPYDYDAAASALAIMDAGPLARMNQFISDSGRNRSGYGTDEMDAAIDELASAVTVEETTAAMGEIQRIWNRDIPNAVYGASEWFVAAKDAVNGLVFTRDATVMFHDAYLES